jgi:hypothetical protein
MLGRGFRFVESLQRTIVSLVEAPALLHRDPQQVELVPGDPARAQGAFEHRAEGDVKGEALGLEQTPRLRRLCASVLGEIDVGPSSEPVLLVPGRLTVAEQNEFVHGDPTRVYRPALRCCVLPIAGLKPRDRVVTHATTVA